MRRSVLVGLVAAATLVLMATPAFAPHVAQLQVTPASVAPGGTVTVWGPRAYAPDSTVEIRFNAADGPLLGTFPTDDQFYATWGPGEVTIPAGLEPGEYLLFATQDLTEEEAYVRGVPARAVIQVAAPGVAAPVAGAPLLQERAGVFAVEPRPAGLVVEQGSPGVGALALLAAGVAAAAVVLGVAAAKLAGRRRQTAEASVERAAR